MTVRWSLLSFATLLCLFSLPPRALAGSFGVSPVRLTLSKAQAIGTLTIKNQGTEPTVIHAEVVGWAQQDGEDVYTPTKDLLVSPPIFSLPPHGAQTIRVGMRRAVDPRYELAYRVYLQEVPPPPKPGVGVQTALRISMPVFLSPVIAAAPKLDWQAVRTPQGAMSLRLSNTGNAHVRLSSFALSVPGSERVLVTQAVSAVLLPQQSRSWQVQVDPPLAPGAPVHVSAQTERGEVHADVVVAGAQP
jgi:fimbrial chaperone protein